ncbi:fungal-specific transcription factor domain-containing protein [Calycina marina]|uniref:Fungal-specific transcription factor domain-containing protein n=1 Tax=Calycina marina TaxID=1763456 RepID=A0A9P8CJE2_9HELO|nr:fungal-specific transcription factor domain-containing protein [Calycina marina]
MEFRRNTSKDPDGQPKRIKSEDPAQFSAVIKKKLQSSSRTGQACDRCKVRKIRCDALSGGCSPCRQTATTCQTTDRTTGQTRVRGAEERLQDENRQLREEIQHLTERLERQSVHQNGRNEVATTNHYQDGPNNGYSYSAAQSQPASTWARNNDTYQPNGRAAFQASQSFRVGTDIGDTFLGLSTGNAHLSHIGGTVLSVFGMEIDLAGFPSMDMDDPNKHSFYPRLYNKSYQSFLQTALNVNERIEKVDLPPRTQGLSFAEWYFRALNPYSPLLHKPTCMKLILSMYDDPNFRPTYAQTVIVHMIFAIMFFQFAVRNEIDKASKDNLTAQSNSHYHYSLSFFYQLASSHTVEDVQALTLICVHLRGFPKSGASWMLTQTTMALAVELGLHRSVKKWVSDAAPSLLEVQMRQRIFWTLLSIHVTLSGKLNRPMILNLEDFDVEVPQPVDDDLLSEIGLDTSRPGKCAHEIGIISYKMVLLFIDMYSTIYAVRAKAEDYIPTVQRLEAKLQEWREQLPAELARGEFGSSEMEGHVFALYAQVWALEFQLLLRHPSKTGTDDPNFNSNSIKICVESSQQMLKAVQALRKYKSLDTTWYQVSVYIMAATVTLYDKLENRDTTTAAELASVQEDTASWLDVLGEVGELIGAGSSIRDKVQSATSSQLGLLSHSLSNRYHHQEESQPIRQQQPVQANYPQPTYAPTHVVNTNSYISTPVQTRMQTPYPPATQYTNYSEATSSRNIAYSPSVTYPTFQQPQGQNVNSTLNTAYDGAAGSSSAHTAPSSNTGLPYRQPPAMSPNLAWQQYANNMTGILEPQDSYSASALMQLPGDASRDVNAMGADLTSQMNFEIPEDLSGQWPMIAFQNHQQQ